MAKHHYKQLALLLHPDKGGSATGFVHLNGLWDLLQTADKKTAAAQAETLAARRSAQHAFTDLNANVNTFNARLAAQTSAVQAQWARWHNEQLAAAGAEAARRHSSELDSARYRIQHLEKQLKELEELKSAKRKRVDAVNEDPLRDYFAESSFKEWGAKLSVERQAQRRMANEWRAGAPPLDEQIIIPTPPTLKRLHLEQKCTPELAAREDIVASAEYEVKGKRDKHDAKQTELDSREADVEAREAEVEHYLQLAVDVEIWQAKLDVQRAQTKEQKMENETEKAELAEKSVELGEREAQLRDCEESCAALVEDHTVVSRDVSYLQQQKAVLEVEVSRLVKHHAALAATFHRLRAEVHSVEP